jgi:predicted RecB family endonuclease
MSKKRAVEVVPGMRDLVLGDGDGESPRGLAQTICENAVIVTGDVVELRALARAFAVLARESSDAVVALMRVADDCETKRRIADMTKIPT